MKVFHRCHCCCYCCGDVAQSSMVDTSVATGLIPFFVLDHFNQSSHSVALTYTNFSPPAFFSQTVVDICRLLPETKVPELVVSILALFVLIVVKELNGCYREKLPLPIPIELIVVGLLLFFFLFTHSLHVTYTAGVFNHYHPAGGVLSTVIWETADFNWLKEGVVCAQSFTFVSFHRS